MNGGKVIFIKNSLAHLDSFILDQIAHILYKSKNPPLLVGSKFLTNDIKHYIEDIEEVDKRYTFAGLEYTLEENNYKYTKEVNNIGEFTKKGDTIILWPAGFENPIRVQFFDEEMEKIEIIDALSKKPIQTLSKIYISNMNYFDEKVELDNFKIIDYKRKKTKLNLLKEENLKIFQKSTDKFIITFRLPEHIEADYIIDISLYYPSLYYSNFDILKKDIKLKQDQGYKIEIITDKTELFDDTFKKLIKPNKFDLLAGFISKLQKRIVLTDREIFRTIFITKEKQKRLKSKQARKLLNTLEGEIQINDYIVHEDHGIGIYKGIIYENNHEYLKIQYAKADELLVPLDKIYKLTKYIGISDKKPEITTLDKINWNKKLQKSKQSIKILAQELVHHYAKIALSKAPQINKIDDPDYQLLLEDFNYEETPDQTKTLKEIFRDLESDKPTNRLIVGDVGFGKTEVIIRASFFAVKNKMQVAILAPTTILVAQHYKVFYERLNKFGIKIAQLSRFQKNYQNKDIITQAKNGKIDILIGTHRLLGNDVEFKNLGLVVIDEEQKFGVRQKEKIRRLKYGAHVISMTATPIPRTLSMALSEIQDISLITTPPSGRKPIKTIVKMHDVNEIAQAIQKEIKRGGQVYFVHNRVQTIYSVTKKLQTLLPNIRFIVAHGQMPGEILEKNINDFYNQKFDCLICTTIIENGIDMPNVNTIIIDDAQNLGLAQLYQLRGRVGRSKRQAFAYIFYKNLENLKAENSKTAKDADQKRRKEKIQKYKQRLEAIKQITQLGGGFEIARRDLEIRGAGTLLGEKQHGHINQIGLGLYMQMLASEIEKLKHYKKTK